MRGVFQGSKERRSRGPCAAASSICSCLVKVTYPLPHRGRARSAPRSHDGDCASKTDAVLFSIEETQLWNNVISISGGHTGSSMHWQRAFVSQRNFVPSQRCCQALGSWQCNDVEMHSPATYKIKFGRRREHRSSLQSSAFQSLPNQPRTSPER